MGIAKKFGATIISALLVVGIVIGAIVISKKNGGTGNPGAPGEVETSEAKSSTTTSAKTVDVICSPTQHKEACVSSLQSVKPDGSIKDYLEAAVNVTLGEVRKALSATGEVVIDKDNDPFNDNKSMESCKNLLNQTINELGEAITKVIRSDISNIQKSAKDFIAWLTGTNIYLQTCVDEMGKPEYKLAVQNGVTNATQLTQNALYIFAKISDVLGQLNVADSLTNFLNGNSTSTTNGTGLFDKLVPNNGTGNSNFPQWVSNGDRKLLAGPDPPPNAVVAQDGSGQFKTIGEAVNSAPLLNTDRFIIQVKAGTYNEQVNIKDKTNLMLIGDGIGKTIITGSQSLQSGGSTSTTATLTVESNNFIGRGFTVQNTAKPEDHQAVALRINGEKVVIMECEITGYQDTLYYHRGLQFFKNCIVSGTVDFIFGYGRAIIQDTMIIARLPGANQSNMITADGGLTPVGQHGLVLQNCKITADPQLMAAKADYKTFLGRPWKEFAVTIFMQNDIQDFIAPEGYSIFEPGSINQNNAIYGEYMNTGPGAKTDLRDKTTFPKWKVLAPPDAEGYTIAKYIDGATWLPATGIPFKAGL